jgi:hypothetical protein
MGVMIDKLAAALWENTQAGWAPRLREAWDAPRKPDDMCYFLKRDRQREHVRVFLAALRHPSEVMVDAGVASEGDGNPGLDVSNSFRAMIDAILAEEN